MKYVKVLGFCIHLFLLNCKLTRGQQPSTKGLCSDSSEIDSLPTVVVFDAKDDIPNKDNNGTVILGKPDEDAAVAWLSLECSHTKPIRWVFDLSYEFGGMGDTYTAITRNVEDFYNSSTYTFTAEVEIKIFHPGIKSVFFCAAFDDPCDRRVVELIYFENEEHYVARLLSRLDENQPLVTDLETAIEKRRQFNNQSGKEEADPHCDVTFSLKDYGIYFDFTFEPKGEIPIVPRTCPDRQMLENAYLFHESVRPKCINENLKCNETTGCEHIFKDETKAWYIPIVFFMSDNKNLSRVVRAYHTTSEKYAKEEVKEIHKNGQIRYSWEKSDYRDMMRLKLTSESSFQTNITQFSFGDKIIVECQLSPFYFSYGTLIGHQVKMEADKITFQPRDDETEPAGQEGDYRVARSVIDIPIDWQNDTEIVEMTIYCYSPIWDSSTEWAKISQDILLLPSSISMAGDNNEVFTEPLRSTFNRTCSTSGIPIPTLTVDLPENSTKVEVTKTIVNDTIYANIMISKLDHTHVGFYNCVATNLAGTKYYEFEIKILKPKSREVSSTLTIVLTAVFGSVSAIFLIVVGILLVRFRMEKEEFRRLTEEAMRDFYEGEDASHIPKKDTEQALHYANDSVKTLPYDRKYEIPHKHWSFNNTILGSGAFGVVRKGHVEIGNRKSIIAVKTVKSVEDIDDFRATLLELKIMAHIGHHRHIVQLIAASTEDIMKRNVFIGVEYCANGSLLTYLQKRKKLFNNLVKDGQIEFPEDFEPEEDGEGLYKNLIVSSDISTIDLYKWSAQIANGMEFLESKKVLHADLASRNILLTEELVIKISDFGLSRDLFTSSEYTKKTNVALPWKWMAIESLRYLKFTSKSDVWGFGVVLYEMFTLGEEPYVGMNWNEEFISSLEDGMRLSRPDFCTLNVYNEIMLKCWEKEPNDRLEFTSALSFFEKAVKLLISSERSNDECRDFC